MAATIKDVARLAGCSIKTVSRVINDEPHVSDEIRERVQIAIRNTGYAPNLSARRLVQQRSFSICILLYPGFDQPASALLSKVLDIGYEENYEILLQSYFPMLSHSKSILVERVNQRRYDGYVITPPCDADDFVTDMLTTYKIPFVLVNPLNRAVGTPYVAGSDYQGAFNMTEHLIRLGHRRIAFLMGPRNMRSSYDRLYGFRAALDSHGVRYDEKYVVDSEFTFDGGWWATRELLALPERPTAIFAGNDAAAFGAMFSVQEAGLRIPADISICGHDDLPTAKYIHPGLTTVHQPVEELIERATRLLLQILKDGKAQQEQIIVNANLVLRGSTGRAPAA
ncbi:MAG: LacI family DNA-binding transcriptional regulator [Anaerolineae bacterium]|nr:LacI family DNA-binding transcriptional regulator [Anaerolineae bacterium]